MPDWIDWTGLGAITLAFIFGFALGICIGTEWKWRVLREYDRKCGTDCDD